MKEQLLLAKSPEQSELIILLHGYTGSPTDFYTLPEYIFETIGSSRKFSVFVPLLKGHGTNPADLAKYSYKELYEDALFQIQQIQTKYNITKIRLIIGYSVGAFFAAQLAEKYNAKTMLVSLPLELKFPFSLGRFFPSSFIPRPTRFGTPTPKRYFYDAVPKRLYEVLDDAKTSFIPLDKKSNCIIIDSHDTYLDSNAISKTFTKSQISHINTPEAHNVFWPPGDEQVNQIVFDFIKDEVTKKNDE